MSKTDMSDGSVNYRLKDTKKPYKDPEVLHRLYWHEGMNQTEISEHLDCGQGTVGEWMRRLNIPRRTMLESRALERPDHQPVKTNRRGYEYWMNLDSIVLVHRLLAVAKYGFDAVCGMDVHHGAPDGGPNELPPAEITWANWLGNIELVAPEEHQRKHLKIDGTDRMAVAEKYEHGDISSRDLADLYDVSSSTVLSIHKEFFGDDNE